MKRLIKFEFYKLLKSKVFIICSCIVLGLNILTMLAMRILLTIDGEILPMSGKQFTLLAMGSSFTMLIGVFTTVFTCTDYDQETIKNIYSRGFSRNAVFWSKYLAVICGTLFMYFLGAVFNYIVGSVTFHGDVEVTDFWLKLVVQILLVFAYTSFSFMIAIVLKRMLSIGMVIVGPIVISLVLTIFSAIIGNGISLNSYWLDGILSYASVDALLTGITGEGVSMDKILAVVLPVAYTVLFTLIGFFANRKSDR